MSPLLNALSLFYSLLYIKGVFSETQSLETDRHGTKEWITFHGNRLVFMIPIVQRQFNQMRTYRCTIWNSETIAFQDLKILD